MAKRGRQARSTTLVACLVAASAIAGPGEWVLAQTVEQDERVAAAFVLALGRRPTSVESERWLAQGPLPIADLIARQRRALHEDAATWRDVMARAAHDALGGAPDSERGVAGTAGADTYFELVQRHLQWLADHPADYEQVVQRAYRAVLQRDAYPIEIDYWKRQPVLTFVLLAGCVENWAVRNQPGLMATTGAAAMSVNSAYLTTVRLSPAVAAEARAAIGLAPAGGRTPSSAAGRHVVAPGAASVLSVGGVHFAAAGGARLADPATAR